MAFSGNSAEAPNHAHGRPDTILRISLLGPFMVEWVAEDGKILPLPTERLSGRGAAPALGLLKALLSQPDRFATRDWLIEQFWPDSPVRKAEERLNDVASGLRSLLRPPGQTTNHLHYIYGSDGKGGGYRLDAYPMIWVDADAFIWYVEQAARFERFGQDALPFWEQAYQLATRGVYLPEERYSDWALARQEMIAGHYRQCVHRLGTLLQKQGASEQAILYLRTYWQQEKTDEDALRVLMELLGEQERYQEAEAYYQQLLLALADFASTEDGHGQEPDPRTREIHEYVSTKQIQGKLVQSHRIKIAKDARKSAEQPLSPRNVDATPFRNADSLPTFPLCGAMQDRERSEAANKYEMASHLESTGIVHLQHIEHLVHLEPQERLRHALRKPAAIDNATIQYLECIASYCWQMIPAVAGTVSRYSREYVLEQLDSVTIMYNQKSISLTHQMDSQRSTFLQASRAGDAALDRGGHALRAESDQGPALTSVTIPGRFRASILSTPVKGRAWRHRLFRTPGMSSVSALP